MNCSVEMKKNTYVRIVKAEQSAQAKSLDSRF